MAKTQKQRECHKRWLRKHPEFAIHQLEVWIGKEKDPEKLALAKMHLKRFLDREKQEAQLNQKQKT